MTRSLFVPFSCFLNVLIRVEGPDQSCLLSYCDPVQQRVLQTVSLKTNLLLPLCFQDWMTFGCLPVDDVLDISLFFCASDQPGGERSKGMIKVKENQDKKKKKERKTWPLHIHFIPSW